MTIVVRVPSWPTRGARGRATDSRNRAPLFPAVTVTPLIRTTLLHALQNPRVNIAGIRRGDLLPDLGMFSPTRLSRQLRRLPDIGVIKRVTGTYRYYLTKAGRAAAAAAGRLTAAVIVPAKASQLSPGQCPPRPEFLSAGPTHDR